MMMRTAAQALKRLSLYTVSPVWKQQLIPKSQSPQLQCDLYGTVWVPALHDTSVTCILKRFSSVKCHIRGCGVEFPPCNWICHSSSQHRICKKLTALLLEISLTGESGCRRVAADGVRLGCQIQVCVLHYHTLVWGVWGENGMSTHLRADRFQLCLESLERKNWISGVKRGGEGGVELNI